MQSKCTSPISVKLMKIKIVSYILYFQLWLLVSIKVIRVGEISKRWATTSATPAIAQRPVILACMFIIVLNFICKAMACLKQFRLRNNENKFLFTFIFIRILSSLNKINLIKILCLEAIYKIFFIIKLPPKLTYIKQFLLF